MNLKTSILIAIFSFSGLMLTAQDNEISRSDEAVAEFKKAAPNIVKIFDSAYGYAVLPSVGKGAIGVGGAAGNGTLYKQGTAVGDIRMTQISIGFQFGGQSYMEMIFFEDEEHYNRFVENDYEFAAQISAVALSAGVSLDAPYKDGVKVYTLAKGGLMYEAAVGGQKFKVTLY